MFVDSSAWYAAADRSDRSNRRAKELLSSGEALVTSDHILVEAWFLIGHRLGRDRADRFWEALREGVARLETVTLGDLESAWRIGRDWPDQSFSIVDRTSFALMQRLGIESACSFDADFSIFRYGPGRKRAFSVAR
jgi:predicted nucleic acid-binding protein